MFTDGSEINSGDATTNQLVNSSSGTVSYTATSSSKSAYIDVPYQNAGLTTVSRGTLELDSTANFASSASATTTNGGVALIQNTIAPDTSSQQGSADGFTLGSNGALSGPGTFTIHTGKTLANANGSLVGGADVVNDGTFDLANGSTVYMLNASTFENASGGTVDFTDSSNFDNYDATANMLLNDQGGTLAYTGTNSSSTASISVALTDDGAASVGRGTLEIDAPVTIGLDETATGAGKFALDNTATPAAGGGVLNGIALTSSSVIAGPGTFTIPTGQTITAAGPTLDGSADVVVAGTLAIPADDTLYFEHGSTVENSATGTISLGSQASLDDYDGATNPPNLLQNDQGGVITFTGLNSSDTASISVLLHNAGTLTSTLGTLQLEHPVVPTSTSTAAGAGVVEVDGTSIAPPSASVGGSLAGLTLSSASVTGPGTLTVPAAATVHTSDGTTLLGAANVVNDGTVDLTAGDTLYFEAASKLTNASGGIITMLDNSSLYSYDGNVGNLLTNQAGGTVAYAGSNNTTQAYLDLPLENAGTLSVTDGTLKCSALKNLSVSGTLTGGTYSAIAPSGDLEVQGPVNSVAATTEIEVAGAGQVTSASTGTNAFAGLKSNAGTLDLAGTETAGALANTGTIDLTGGTLTATSLTQTAGTTTVGEGATLQAGATGTGSVKVTGGTVVGGGTVKAATTLAGTLEVDVNVTAPTLMVTGTATLGGKLNIVTTTAPTSGAVLVPVSATSLKGQFASIAGGTITSSLFYVPSYGSTALHLTVGPAALTAVSPKAVGAGASAVPVVLTGAGFVSGATIASPETGVTFSSVTVAAGGSIITAKESVTATAHAGTISAKVNQSGGSLTCASCLTIDKPPAFKSNSSKAFSPASLVQSSSKKTVTISGSGFVAGLKVTFSGTGVTDTVSKVTASAITLKVTVTKTAAAGARTVTITNADHGTASCSKCFTVTKKAASVKAVAAAATFAQGRSGVRVAGRAARLARAVRLV